LFFVLFLIKFIFSKSSNLFFTTSSAATEGVGARKSTIHIDLYMRQFEILQIFQKVIK